MELELKGTRTHTHKSISYYKYSLILFIEGKYFVGLVLKKKLFVMETMEKGRMAVFPPEEDNFHELSLGKKTAYMKILGD